jgi:hypothetical protein
MKWLITSLVLCVAAAPAYAAPKPCEELKAEIAAKIDAKKVAGYTLTIAPNDQVGDGIIVGSCDGGTKKIVYEKR